MAKTQKKIVEEKPTEFAPFPSVVQYKLTDNGFTYQVKEGESYKDIKVDKLQLTPLDIYGQYTASKINPKTKKYIFVGESVLLGEGQKGAKYYDTCGTERLGQIPNAQIPSSWNEGDKLMNKKKANFYNVLFGVTPEGQLVRLNLTYNRIQAFKEAMLKSKAEFYANLLLEFTITDKVMDVKVVKKNLKPETFDEIALEMERYVEIVNKKIMKEFKANGGKTEDTKAYEAKDKALVDDLDDDATF